MTRKFAIKIAKKETLKCSVRLTIVSFVYRLFKKKKKIHIIYFVYKLLYSLFFKKKKKLSIIAIKKKFPSRPIIHHKKNYLTRKTRTTYFFFNE